MTNEYERKLADFEEKVKQLLLDYQKVKQKNQTLVLELENARSEVRTAHRDFVDLQEQYRQFRVTNAWAGGDSVEKKRHIESVVRKIDKCMELLKE